MRLSPMQRRVVATLGFCGLVSAADNWFVSPALPAIAQALGVLPSVAAVVLTAYLMPYGLLQPVCGAVGDSVGRVRLLHVIVAGLAASTVACAMAPDLATLVAARLVTGCFAAGIISVSQAVVGQVTDAGTRAGAVGLLMGITFAGQGLSAGLGGVLCDLVGWRAAFVAFGVAAALAWLGLWRLPAEACAHGDVRAAGADEADGSDPRREPAAATVADGPQPGRRALLAVRSAAGAACGFVRSAARTFLGPSRAVFLAACSTGVVFLGVYGLMGTFLAERCGLGATQAGLVMMFYGVACLVGGGVSGRIAARGGVDGVVLVGEASGIGAMALLLAATLTGSWAPALGAAALLGLGYILVQPSLVTLSMGADPARQGLCTGLVGLGVFAGGGLGGILGQALLGSGGWAVLWAVAGCGLVAQAALCLRPLRALAR